MFCPQDSGIARGQTLPVATKNFVWRGVVSPLKAVSLDIECNTIQYNILYLTKGDVITQ